MADQVNEKNAREALGKSLSALFSFTPEDLVRADDLGKELNFQEAVPYIERALALFEPFRNANLCSLPAAILNLVRGQVDTVVNTLWNIKKFSPTMGDPSGARRQLIIQIRDAFDNSFGPLLPSLSYTLANRAHPLSQAESDARTLLEKLAAETEKARERQDQVTQEMEQTLDKVKLLAADAGVSSYAGMFGREAIEHRKASLYWFGATVALTVGAAIYSLYSFHWALAALGDSTANWWEHAAYLASRLLVLSAIFFGVGWSAKNYRSHKHNEVINRHRENALAAFETFAKAASDRETKDMVLMQATKAIFEGQSSGYLSAEGDQVPSNTIIEVLRRVTSERGGH